MEETIDQKLEEAAPEAVDPSTNDAEQRAPHWLRWVAGGVVLGVLVGLGSGVTSLPRYRSRASVATGQVDAAGQIAEPARGDLIGAAGRKLLKSGHTELVEKNDWGSRLLRRMHLVGDRQIAYATMVRDAGDRVKLLAAGRRIEMQCEAMDAELARDECNSVAEQFVRRMRSAEPAGEDDVVQRQIRALNAQTAEWSGELGGTDFGAEISSAALHELAPVQQGLVDTEIERMRLDEGPGTASENSAEFLSTRHREELLRLSYEARLSQLSAAARLSAKRALLGLEIAGGRQLLQTLQQRLAEFDAAANRARVVERATADDHAVAPNHLLEGAAGGLGGALVGICFAGVLEARRRRPGVQAVPMAEAPAQRLVELGRVPQDEQFSGEASGGVSGLDEKSLGVGAIYEDAAYSLLQEDWGKGARVYAVVSGEAGEGRTSVTAHLGMALSSIGLRVLLIDADLTAPRLHELFGVENDYGLCDLLRSGIGLDRVPLRLVLHTTAIGSLSMVPAGNDDEDCLERMAAPAVDVLLRRLLAEFDVILMDVSPLSSLRRKAFHEGMLAGADGMVLVVRGDGTEVKRAQAGAKRLSEAGRRVVGVIVNASEPA